MCGKMTGPDLDIFADHFDGHRTQLVTRWISADTETPISAFLKICGDDSYAFLFESVEGGSTLGRYTIIGFDPDVVWKYEAGMVSINGTVIDQHALPSLKKTVRDCFIDYIPESMPPMAASGLFGFMGYDMIREAEKIPDNNPDVLHIPDAIYSRPRCLIIFDNIKHKICISCPVYTHAGNSDKKARAVHDDSMSRIDKIIERLHGPLPDARPSDTPSEKIEFASNMSRSDFANMVAKAKDYIRAGDVFQVVLGQRFSGEFPLSALDLYRSLRRINPSPFLFLVNFPGFSLIGSSPEILVRVREGKVTIRPIAGTRKRGKTKLEDEKLAAELLADPKERSEHLMLLDLGRNDVGRVSDIGTVRVTEQFAIENYSHVMHIISNVEGNLRNEVDPIDALMAGFPAGTVSGAPKIRAMEIIDELEPDKRKFYGGCVGYLAGNGNIDTCIALRTALLKDGVLHVQAGAGIVADSVEEAEYQETIDKSGAIRASAQDAIENAFLKRKAHNQS